MQRLSSIFSITFRRLWAQKGLTVATAVGLTVVVALLMIGPLYAGAVYYQLLQDDIDRVAKQTNRPPFTYFLQYRGQRQTSLQWEQIAAAHAYLASDAPALGLPILFRASYLATDEFRLFPSGTSSFNGRQGAIATIQFATVGGLEEQITLIEGDWPATNAANDPFNILVTNGLAQRLGLQIGASFVAYDHRNQGSDGQQDQFPVRVAGIWQPQDVNSDYWFKVPGTFDEVLIIPEETFSRRLSPAIHDEIYEGIWQFVLDGSAIDTDAVNRMVSRATAVDQRVSTLLPAATLLQSPVEALQLYYISVSSLTLLLTAFNIPIIGLTLAFIGLVVGLAVNEQRNEIAVMRSRGATSLQIIGMAVLEGLFLGAVALLLGALLALLLTQLMGRTRSFLDFSATSQLRVVLTGSAWRAGLTAVGLALVARIMPMLTAVRYTVITYKQERARALNNPWWQRVWLDLLLAIPAAYGFYLLRQQGSLLTAATDNTATAVSATAAQGSDPFQDPLLLLVPALAIFAATLFCLRLLPIFMRGLSWLLAQTNSVGLLLAVRQLARSPSFYAMPLLLLILTVSLSVFTASLARTMDLQLYDQSYYQIGADVRLFDFGGQPRSRTPSTSYYFLPLSAYQNIPGVLGATRVGRYETSANVDRQDYAGFFMGIDRATFAQAAFWRIDFAPQQLGTLLNQLATPNGVLLPLRFMQNQGLRPGDPFNQTVTFPGGTVTLDNQIVGSFDYFPSWYPEQDGLLVVGNLDALFAATGGNFPYHIWLRAEPGLWADPTAVLQDNLRAQQGGNREIAEPFSRIRLEQTRPERQGLFGLLSVGFAAAALLTVLGFFLYALFSFRRRFIELGVLRAVGLSTPQMIFLLAAELATLISLGLGVGTLLGTWVSQQFIPYLQIGTSETQLVPPYLVEIAWSSIFQIYILFALLFLVAMVVLGGLLLRMQIFQAVKLGETT